MMRSASATKRVGLAMSVQLLAGMEAASLMIAYIERGMAVCN
jgi:hypothetical protein